jgi:hypothetical protein
MDVVQSWSPKFERRPHETLENERVPTPEELRRILGVMSPRGRAATLLIASSGIRIGTLGGRFSADGLRLKHLPELELEHGTPRFATIPFLVRVPASLSKSRKEYFTFGTSECAEAITAYLLERRNRGEQLSATSALIAPEYKTSRTHLRPAADGTAFVNEKSLSFYLRSSMDKVRPGDVRWRAYTLRSWFSTQMESAEAKGLITRSRREFFMGHQLGIDGVYNLDKKLSSQKVEELRAAYKRCEPFLSTLATRSDQDDRARMTRIMLMGLGYTEEELGQVDFDHLDVGVFQDLVTKKVTSSGKHANQQVVDAAELPGFLEKGWTVVTAVNGHQVVLNPPA